ncbi:MAG: YlbF family regulator [Nitriliruptor sp.]|nr:MAG: YlbF family regulator [Nitriliruptor sp.]
MAATTLETSADHLALQLAYEPAVIELREARAALDSDTEARSLVERYQQTHLELATKQRAGDVLTDEQISVFQGLQASIQSHPTIRRLVEAEQDATAMLTAVAAEIDEHAGIDFTRLAARGGC